MPTLKRQNGKLLRCNDRLATVCCEEEECWQEFDLCPGSLSGDPVIVVPVPCGSPFAAGNVYRVWSGCYTATDRIRNDDGGFAVEQVITAHGSCTACIGIECSDLLPRTCPQNAVRFYPKWTGIVATFFAPDPFPESCVFPTECALDPGVIFECVGAIPTRQWCIDLNDRTSSNVTGGTCISEETPPPVFFPTNCLICQEPNVERPYHHWFYSTRLDQVLEYDNGQFGSLGRLSALWTSPITDPDDPTAGPWTLDTGEAEVVQGGGDIVASSFGSLEWVSA